MPRARIIEVNYHEFRTALRKAVDTDARIITKAKKSWESWVKEHKIKEASFRAVVQNQWEKSEAVIIKSGEWTGYYRYSEQEEACLKWHDGE